MLFEYYDTSGDGSIDFEEFKHLVQQIDSNMAKWKIHSLFYSATGTNSLDAEINFDMFVSAAMNNPLLDGIMDLGYERPLEDPTG